MTDLLIIGAGTAGLTAAIYGERAGLSCTVFEQGTPGGKIVASPEVANYPAMPNVSGYDYAMALFEQAKACGAEVVFAQAVSADLSGSVKKIKTTDGDFEAKTVIIANGASRKKIGCKGEADFEGRGVSYCATCDGAFFRGKTVAVVGGGDTAFEDAAYLAGICDKVYLINRGGEFTATETLVDPVLKSKNVTVLNNSEITEIRGEGAVSSAVVRNRGSKSETELPLSAVFAAVGIAPDNSAFSSVLKLDDRGYIIAGEDCLTGIPGVFVAGDTRQKALRQLVTAAADGAVAATAAFRYIRENFKD